MTLAAIAQPLAWGAKVSPAFRDKVRGISADLGCDPSDLMACMAWESGRTFSPSVLNMAGSGAVGLIQFMPTTAAGIGTSCAALGKMTAVDQLAYVAKYFAHYKGRLHTLADVYMVILWPRAVGEPDSYVIFDRANLDHPAQYRQNAGLDIDKNGQVTKAEAAAKVFAIKAEGLLPANAA